MNNPTPPQQPQDVPTPWLRLVRRMIAEVSKNGDGIGVITIRVVVDRQTPVFYVCSPIVKIEPKSAASEILGILAP
jgi:hypothetical protein